MREGSDRKFEAIAVLGDGRPSGKAVGVEVSPVHDVNT